MAGEELLKLFEQNWWERPIFKKDKDPLNLNENVREKVEDKEEEEEAVKIKKKKKKTKTSLFVSSSDDLFLSSRSVLTAKATPTKLQTILSGKEVNEFSTVERERILSGNSEKEEEKKKKQNSVRRTRRKSMSDLENEELKGFMDLGFVFSEEDHKDSELVSLLPGLKRLGKKDDGVANVTEEDISNENRVARPYLSEAWGHCGDRKGKRQITPVIKWKVPGPGVNKTELRGHAKLWAHEVASTIRRL